LRALRELNSSLGVSTHIQPSQCLVIEDSLHGVAAAHAAGMKCLAVTNSYSADELFAADWVIDSLENYNLEDGVMESTTL
jgi:beta-phosphoglucomutase-like phosphatase (HAD superfamily)